MSKLKELIKEQYNIEVNNIKELTKNTYLLNKEYLLKRTKKSVDDVYRYLRSQGIDNVVYPLLNKNKEICFEHQNHYYFLIKYVNNVEYPLQRKVMDIQKELYKIHIFTETEKKIDKKRVATRLKNIYLKLDYKFKILEAFIRSIESKHNIDEFDFLILEDYHIFLNAKQLLYKLQTDIFNKVKNIPTLKYSLLHGNPTTNHIIVDGNKYLISFEKSIVGVPSIDMGKYYLANEEIDVDIMKIIYEWLNLYKDDFYKYHFQFFVLYNYILRLDLTNVDYVVFDSYRNIARKINKFLTTLAIFRGAEQTNEK